MPGRIVFTRMENAELPAAYRAADVFTLGSLHETFGIVYIEAMAMELPGRSNQARLFLLLEYDSPCLIW